jgi:hypothetical protein
MKSDTRSAAKMLDQLKLLVRQLKWGRPETRLALCGFSLLVGGGWLQKTKLFEAIEPYDGWAAIGLLALGAALVALATAKLWKLSSRPPDISELDGPVVRGASSFTPEDGELFKRLGRQEELAKLRDWILDD